MDVGSKGRGARWLGQAALLVALLPGCSTVETFYAVQQPFETPIDWWHQLQGGVIADERPPPPGVGDPYPNLGTIPARPAPTPASVRVALSARLANERDRTDRLALQDPIGSVPKPGAPGTAGALAAASPGAPTAVPATPSPAAPPPAAPSPAAPLPAAPSPAAPPPAAPPSASEASAAPMARIVAADAPPPTPAPRPAPAPAAPAALQAAASPKAPPRQPTAGAPLPSGPVPALPAAAPALPALDGIPAATFAPAIPKPPPQVDASFLLGSAVLRPESDAALRQLASRRGGGPVAVLGGGDAASSTVDAQAAALPLAWRRARAIQDVLASAGVPTSAMHVDAAALARGGIARLVE